MANPFKNRFDSDCNSCGARMDEGDFVYVDDGMFLCTMCATEADIVCECGRKKRAEFPVCWDCNNEVVNMPDGFGYEEM